MRALEQLPLVLTGDLNSQQDSAVYEFLHRGQVTHSHPHIHAPTHTHTHNTHIHIHIHIHI
jgi:hypothetical protein